MPSQSSLSLGALISPSFLYYIEMHPNMFWVLYCIIVGKTK